MRFSIYVILILLCGLFMIDKINGADMCVSDGGAEEVDWWFITKVKGFGDTYLYYDSTMNGNEFKVGYFLRSEVSALGATLKDYSGDTKKNFISYCDYAASQATPFKGFAKLYASGAHQKGILGWVEAGSEWKGFYIDHSMPKFPQPQFKTTFMNPPLNFDPSKVPTADMIQVQKYFGFYGWSAPFFGKNLMPMYTGKKCSQRVVQDYETDKLGPIQLAEKVYTVGSARGAEYYKNERMRLDSKVANIVIYDLHPFSLIYTTSVKPSQHIFCVSIDKKQKFIDLFKQLQYISDGGIVSNIHHVESQVLADIQPYVSLYSAEDTNPRPTVVDRSAQPEFKNQELEFNNAFKVYSTINTKGTSDVWTGLFKNTNEPKFKGDGTGDNKLYISTWISNYDQGWWRADPVYKTKVLEPVFKASIYQSEIKWKSNCMNDHSKIAFTKDPNHDKWNVCVGGGNLYAKNDGIKSSIIMCFKADGLNSALQELTVDSWDGVPSKAEQAEMKKYRDAIKDGDFDDDEIEQDANIATIPGFDQTFSNQVTLSKFNSATLCQLVNSQPSTDYKFETTITPSFDRRYEIGTLSTTVTRPIYNFFPAYDESKSGSKKVAKITHSSLKNNELVSLTSQDPIQTQLSRLIPENVQNHLRINIKD